MTELFNSPDTILVDKYSTTGFMYTEYPHKSIWTEDFGDAGYRRALAELAATPDAKPILLYVHTPYCPQLCWFCTCHVAITQKHERVNRHMESVFAEIALLKNYADEIGWTPDIREIHLGGGSPTFLQEPDFKALIDNLRTLVDFDRLDEIAIEIDPRRVDRDRMHFYADQGITRISFGLQDFDMAVQEAVNRIQPPELIEELLTDDVRARFESINFDVICGLPRQTPDTIRTTMNRIADIGPDRVCFNYLHYTPKLAKHQKMMPAEDLPDFNQRKDIFVEALDVLHGRGYVRTGYDHFAKPTDGVAKSLESGDMLWNSLGYTPGRCENLIGIGAHSYSRIGDNYYAQNIYELPDYTAAVSAGQFPIYRGHKLDADDRLRRDITQTLRSFFRIDYADIEARHGISFADTFAHELESLKELEADGVVDVTDAAIVITEKGMQFTNIVCRVFDRYYIDSLKNQDFFGRALNNS
ncbi:MAG: oxygen-independent coproporphyrinogen III oxidase [Alphaproteobacteria bacterium]